MRALAVLAVIGALALVVAARACVAAATETRPTGVLEHGAHSTPTRCLFAGSAGDFDADGALDVVAIEATEGPAVDTAALRVFSGRTRRVVFEVALPAAPPCATAIACGDVDGDGRNDLALGWPTGDATSSAAAGDVLVYSGQDGRTLVRRTGAQPGERFGATIVRLDDIDGDGASELAVASPEFDARRPSVGAGTRRGRVEIVSGRTLAPLAVVTGEHEDASLGASLVALDDLDGDGSRDWLASAHGTDDDGVACAHSGRTAKLLYVARGDSRKFGRALASIGDTDGDGSCDFVASAGDDFESERVELRSGRDGRRIARIDSPPRETFNWLEPYGAVLGSPGDVDRDGVPDVFVGAPGWKSHENHYGFAGGRAWIHSGRTGEVLLDLRDEAHLDGLGSFFAPLGDPDGDGDVEFLAATQRELRVYSTR